MSAIHIHCDEYGDYEVWLNPQHGERFAGFCVASASTRERAVLDALLELVTVTEHMRRAMYTSDDEFGK